MTAVVVDSSAVAAIVLGEPERERFHAYLLSAAGLMSAATRVELGFVLLKKYGAERLPHLWRLIDRYNFRLEPVDAAQVAVALDALARFGRARRLPPAGLNYGNVFAYALAKSRDLPLLYKGNDFSQTDVRPALPQSGHEG